MFNLDEAISRWRRQMAAGGIKAPEVLEELESHLRDELDAQVLAGLGEQHAFDPAVQRIGDGAALKREFRKVDRLRNNPLWLNIVALWLIVTGLSNLNLHVRGLVLNAFGLGHFSIGQIAWSILPILLGVGLLRRTNLFRVCAIAWFALHITGNAMFIAVHGFSGSVYDYAHHIPASTATVQYVVLGVFSASYPVFYSVLLFNTAMWFVGLFLLTKPLIRKRFRQITT